MTFRRQAGLAHVSGVGAKIEPMLERFMSQR